MLDVVSASVWHVGQNLADVVLTLLHALEVGFKLVRLVGLLRLLLFFVLLIQLAVPNLLDFFNLIFAEPLPVRHLLALLQGFVVDFV